MKITLSLSHFRWSKADFSMILMMCFTQFIFLCPDGLSHTPVHRYVRLMQTAFCVLAMALFLIKYLNNKYIWANVSFFIVLTIATIRVNPDYESLLFYISRSLGIVILYYYAHQRNHLLFWKCASDYFSIIALANTLLTVIRPSGLFFDISENGADVAYFLLGNQNQVIPFYIIGISIAVIYYRLSGKKKWRGLFIYLQALLCDLICGSQTSLVMLFVFALLFLMLPKNKKMTKFRKRIAFIGIILVFAWYYALLVLNVQVLFEGVIENVLHKDVTLSTRVYIWLQAFILIKESPLLGYGASTRRLLEFGNSSFDAHNIALQILLMGGVLLLIALIIIIVMAFRNWVNCKNNARTVGLILFITLAIGSSTEVYAFTYIFLVLLIIYLLGQYRGEIIT